MANLLAHTVFYLLSIILCISASGHKTWQKEYEYIVVGGGTAGSIVAARLSEDENVNVLVLEAGGEIMDPFVRIPRVYWNILDNPDLVWGHQTQPQSVSPSKKVVALGPSKMIGGCGSSQALFYTRGSPHDFNKWDAMGNYNWSYNAVLPYFKKSEMMLNTMLASNGYHGINGKVKTRELERDTIVEEFIKAGQEMGFQELQDVNGKTIQGVSRLQMNTDEKGERASSYNSYLKPARSRRNLDVVTNAHVEKVSFNMDYGIPRADGVYFVTGGQSYFIKCKKEVIVCGGAIGSPTVLMRSGIGPRLHLESLGIAVVADLPVGNNLQDHVEVLIPYYLNETSTPFTRNKAFTFEALFNQIFTGKGPWSSDVLAFSFNRSKNQPSMDLFPYIEHTYNEAYFALPTNIADNVRMGNKITKAMVTQLVDSEKGNIPLSASAILLHAKSRGTVRLNKYDIMKNPNISYNYLSDPKDMEDMIEAIRNIQRFLKTNVMLAAKVMPLTPHANCLNHVFDSDSYWECYIVNTFVSYFHASSTCKMANDQTGVVDERLNVKDVLGLRVADASIMPMIISGHTAAPAMMIGEKAADMIKMDMGIVVEPEPDSGCMLTHMTGLIYGLILAALTVSSNWI